MQCSRKGHNDPVGHIPPAKSVLGPIVQKSSYVHLFICSSTCVVELAGFSHFFYEAVLIAGRLHIPIAL